MTSIRPDVVDVVKLQRATNGAVQLRATASCLQWTIQRHELERSRVLMHALALADSEADAELQVPDGYIAAWVELLQLDEGGGVIPAISLPQCTKVRP